MSKSENFISVDWGSTNFRLKVIDSKSINTLFDLSSSNGIKFLTRGAKKKDYEKILGDFLEEQLNSIPDTFKDLKVVISGMASSNLGLKELDYAELPINFNGEGMAWEWLSDRILLISGLKGEQDVMRGEETQIVGIRESLKDLESGCLILPGTHSKHVFFKEEIRALTCSNSIKILKIMYRLCVLHAPY